MRRISRADRTINLLRKRAIITASNTCTSCSQALAFSSSPARTAKLPATEKFRQKIWGTDQPPGLADPYGGPSFLERRRAKGQSAEPAARGNAETLEAPKAVKPDWTTYEPATSWDGLEKVGGWGKWWQENWDPENKFKGFLPAERITDLEEVTGALHRALVEVLALRDAGIPISEISKRQPGEDLTTEIQIIPSEAGATLQFSDGTSLHDVIQSLSPALDETETKINPTESEEDVAADRSIVDPLHPDSTEPIEEPAEKTEPTESQEDIDADRSPVDPLGGVRMNYEAAIESWGSEWYKTSLADLEIKFAVLKRVMQLTAVRIPDHAIQSSNTAHALLTNLATPEKPRKVVDYLAANEELMTLPNVSVFAKRITPIDKERMVGRWKIIEEELEKKGLPVTGR